MQSASFAGVRCSSMSTPIVSAALRIKRLSIGNGQDGGLHPPYACYACATRLLASDATVALWDRDGATLDRAVKELVGTGAVPAAIVDITDERAVVSLAPKNTPTVVLHT